jgi:hypothetical protein
MEQFIDSVSIDDRVWSVYATFEADGTISFVRMAYGLVTIHEFRPGTENNTITKAGMAVVAAKLAIEKINFFPLPVAPDESDDELFEDFDE